MNSDNATQRGINEQVDIENAKLSDSQFLSTSHHACQQQHIIPQCSPTKTLHLPIPIPISKRTMPICISCTTPVQTLYTTYSKADDRSLGKGVRLTQCPQCGRFADKYVEHDFVVLFIDLVLVKSEVCI
jgi:hypothetical protein